METNELLKIPDDPEAVRVGATVKTIRESRGLTQEELATAALISRPYLANIETGRKKPGYKAIAKLSRALACRPIALMVTGTDLDAA